MLDNIHQETHGIPDNENCAADWLEGINWNEKPESPYGKQYEVVWVESVKYPEIGGGWHTYLPEKGVYKEIGRGSSCFWPIDGNEGGEYDDDKYYKVFRDPREPVSTFNITSTDYTLVEDEGAFYKLYPLPTKGVYRKQPSYLPDKFPCLIKEVDWVYRDNGPDEIILNIEYNFT